MQWVLLLVSLAVGAGKEVRCTIRFKICIAAEFYI